MIELMKFLNDLKQIALDNLKKLKAWEFTGLILAVGAISWLVATNRSDKQIQDAYVLSKEKDCQTELIKCRSEKDFDNRYWKEREDSLTKYWNDRQDRQLLMIFELKTEFEIYKKRK